MFHFRARALGILGSGFAAATFAHGSASAQNIVAPPKDAEAIVAAPKDVPAAPVKEDKLDGTTVSLSAGGQISTGNSPLTAGTVNAKYETRFHDNGIGFDILGNYGSTGNDEEQVHKLSAENIQGRLRYDRYVLDNLSVFVLNTGRHDRFQGLDFRYNLDPGVKYLFVQHPTTKAWGELGYDLQYDVRRDEARVQGDGTVLPKTALDHSVRAFLGFNHAFNDAVTFSTGLEYLQSVVESRRWRMNYDALLAAKLFGGLALGVGFNLRYDHDPLPSIERLDTQTVLSVIYSYSSAAAPPKSEEPPPCPPVPACPTTPAAAPAPAPAPLTPTSPDAPGPGEAMAPLNPAPPTAPPPGATPNTPPTPSVP
jgi:putative salt-induced outer membrane protein YdiY